MIDVDVLNADILREPSDLLILKHADAFYGVDRVVSDLIGFQGPIALGHHAFRTGIGLGAKEALFLGVGPLQDFRYAGIRQFAEKALVLAANHDAGIQTVSSPVHGFGYGLDVGEAFRSMIAGFYDAVSQDTQPKSLKRIVVVERDASRARRFKELLEGLTRNAPERVGDGMRQIRRPTRVENVGAKSEQKKKLVVAMPFAEDYVDIWEIAIQEACSAAGILCEHMGLQSYTGDVMAQIKKRVEGSCGVIGVLNDANPNVFLEVGYAWGLGKPTILITNDVKSLPYDVSGQKCLEYKSISGLRKQLKEELVQLLANGGFD